MAATGKAITMDEAAFDRFDDGRVIGWAAVPDLFGTMRQLNGA